MSFDFLGWGASDKPAGDRRTAAKQTREVDAVIEQLRLDPVVLVAHDASGPPAIDWARSLAEHAGERSRPLRHRRTDPFQVIA